MKVIYDQYDQKQRPVEAISTSITTNWVIILLTAHVLLGLAVNQIPQLSTIHVYAAIGLGVFWAISRPQLYAAYAASYVVGSEVFWRMADASFFWEGGKYAVVLILGLSLVHHKIRRIPVLPLIYFLFLLPSVLLTLEALNLNQARQAISFNLSGPFALFVSVWFFSRMTLKRKDLQVILISVMSPICATATYALIRTAQASRIEWVNDAMFVTSGGFGPNQVSIIMGLGLVCVLIYLLFSKSSKLIFVLMISLGMALLVQGLLTFSRGGIFGAFIVGCFVVFHFLSNKRQRARSLLIIFITLAIVSILILPVIYEFSGGTLQTRFTDLNLTNRDAFVSEEIALFQQNPIFGVGPGMGNPIRGAASHTEITRLLAEHGLLGILSIFLLCIMTLRRYTASSTNIHRGLYGGLMLWSLIVMTNAAMRLAAISFTFGLAFANIDLDD